VVTIFHHFEITISDFRIKFLAKKSVMAGTSFNGRDNCFFLLVMPAMDFINNENIMKSGADPEKMVTGLCERSERDERQRAVSSEARNLQLGGLGGRCKPPQRGMGRSPRKFSIFDL
jgi:hypothetical protein